MAAGDFDGDDALAILSVFFSTFRLRNDPDLSVSFLESFPLLPSEEGSFDVDSCLIGKRRLSFREWAVFVIGDP